MCVCFDFVVKKYILKLLLSYTFLQINASKNFQSLVRYYCLSIQ